MGGLVRLLVFDTYSIYFYTNRIIMCHVVERTKSNTKGNLFSCKVYFSIILITLLYLWSIAMITCFSTLHGLVSLFLGSYSCYRESMSIECNKDSKKNLTYTGLKKKQFKPYLLQNYKIQNFVYGEGK